MGEAGYKITSFRDGSNHFFMDFFTAPDDLFIFTAVHTQITFKGMPGAAPEGHF